MIETVGNNTVKAKTFKINADRERNVPINGIGIPFGGIGTGYSVLGRYGFLRENFDSTPDFLPDLYPYCPDNSWEYEDNSSFPALYAFILKTVDLEFALQEKPVDWYPKAKPVNRISAEARLPKGFFEFKGIPGLELKLTAFSPLIPNDLKESSIPVQVFDFEICNSSKVRQDFSLRLQNKYYTMREANILTFNNPHGESSFCCSNGEVVNGHPQKDFSLAPGEKSDTRFIITWHYPYFKTPSPNAREHYKRYYTTRFANSIEVMNYALKNASCWSEEIDNWHDSFDVPGSFFRLWFSSLAATITGTMLADDGTFFEIEHPHFWVNTMDVAVYSAWCNMINWPELEQQDMVQFLDMIADSGDKAGFVWHSLWDDASAYEEEPTFLLRLYRDYVWSRNKKFASQAWNKAKLAAERVLQNSTEGRLIYSSHGNQSYDLWKMPGISAYVNSAWVYGLQALEMLAKELDKDYKFENSTVCDIRQRAAKAFDRTLWNPETQCWNCFKTNEETTSNEDTVFLDQLFGKWVMGIVANAEEIFSAEKIKGIVQKLYTHNIIEKDGRFRGWANGMLPDGKPDMCSTHARTCWLGTQINLASLLGMYNCEDEALDVFYSIEQSLNNNHLAVGEWNWAVNEQGKPELLAEENGKDTPRFPPYPRYKSCWEFLPRILGMKLDFNDFYFSPFKSLDLSLREITLAGTKFTIMVEQNWNVCTLNGREVEVPVKVSRDLNKCILSFNRK